MVNTAGCLSMASVFKADDREMVLRGSGTALENIDIYTSTIKYVPSLLERLGHGSAVDLGDIYGVNMFESTYGLKIDGCKTLDDVINAVRTEIALRKHSNESYYL